MTDAISIIDFGEAMNLNYLSPYVRLAMDSTLGPSHIINPRVIFDYELIYTLDGECTITFGNTPYICKKGDAVFIRPGELHSFVIPDHTSFVQPHIHFDAVYNENSEITPISFKSLANMTAHEKALIQQDILDGVEIPHIFKPSSPSEFRNLIFKAIHTFNEDKSNQLSLKITTLELLSMIINQFSSPLSKAPISDGRTQAIKEYIDNNYLNIITLDMLSEQFSVNKYTALRKFKSTYGVSIIEYYNNKRFECSKRFLDTTDMSVTEISRILNFTDEYSFSRFFKNINGLSPLNYKKNRPPQ